MSGSGTKSIGRENEIIWRGTPQWETTQIACICEWLAKVGEEWQKLRQSMKAWEVSAVGIKCCERLTLCFSYTEIMATHLPVSAYTPPFPLQLIARFVSSICVSLYATHRLPPVKLISGGSEKRILLPQWSPSDPQVLSIGVSRFCSNYAWVLFRARLTRWIYINTVRYIIHAISWCSGGCHCIRPTW